MSRAVTAGVLLALLATNAHAALSAPGLHTIPNEACNGEIQGIPYRYKGPKTIRVKLTNRSAVKLAAYNGVMLAPRGWHCDLEGGSDGAMLKAYNPAGGFFPSLTGGYQPQDAVSVYYATTGTHALEQACTFFTEAASLLKKMGLGGCSPREVLGETLTQRTVDELDFVDPPKVRDGTGDPSGGMNRAMGVELYDDWYDTSKGRVDNAATGTCTLPSRQRGLCTAILAFVRTQFQLTLRATH